MKTNLGRTRQAHTEVGQALRGRRLTQTEMSPNCPTTSTRFPQGFWREGGRLGKHLHCPQTGAGTARPGKACKCTWEQREILRWKHIGGSRRAHHKGSANDFEPESQDHGEESRIEAQEMTSLHWKAISKEKGCREARLESGRYPGSSS